MTFDCDAFISYSHIDNVGLAHGSEGWITKLHFALENRVAQFLGEQTHFWRDPKLAGNDFFENTLIDQLNQVAVLITIVTPRYVRSEWTRKELVEFWKAAEAQGGVRFNDKARIFKVLKTPIPRDMDPPELQPLLGYEFFKTDPNTGRTRELDGIFGEQAQSDFWMKLDDLAQDIAKLLGILRAGKALYAGETSGKEGIFLAETTSDLQEQRDSLRRDLQQHGYTVFPAGGFPLYAPDLKTRLREELARCRMSIHPIGKHYGVVPESSDLSLVEIQNELAIERAQAGEFTRLLWIPSGMTVEDEKQAKVIERFRMDPRLQADADLLETFLEDLKTVIHDRLKATPKAAEEVAEAPSEICKGLIYLIYDQRDEIAASSYADFLFENRFDVTYPPTGGDESSLRQDHEEKLRICDGVIVFFGSLKESWVRGKLREVLKSVGYGRTAAIAAAAVVCIGPHTPEKDRFRTHEAQVFLHMDTVSPDGLQPFLARVCP